MGRPTASLPPGSPRRTTAFHHGLSRWPGSCVALRACALLQGPTAASHPSLYPSNTHSPPALDHATPTTSSYAALHALHACHGMAWGEYIQCIVVKKASSHPRGCHRGCHNAASQQLGTGRRMVLRFGWCCTRRYVDALVPPMTSVYVRARAMYPLRGGDSTATAGVRYETGHSPDDEMGVVIVISDPALRPRSKELAAGPTGDLQRLAHTKLGTGAP